MISLNRTHVQITRNADTATRQSPLVTELRLYDVVNVIGVATDLNHIDTPPPVKGYLPENDGLRHALTGAEVVLISAGGYPETDKQREK